MVTTSKDLCTKIPQEESVARKNRALLCTLFGRRRRPLFFWVVFVVCFTTLSSARFWFSLARRKERFARCFVQRHFKHDGTTGSPKMGRPSASVSSPAKPTLTFANKRSGGDASTKGGHSFVGGKEDVKEAAAVFGGGGPITVAVLLLLNGDLEIADAAERDAVARLTIIGRGKFRHPKRRRRRPRRRPPR